MKARKPSPLERLIDERAGQMLVATVSVAVEKIAEEIAREALSDESFRQTLRVLVQERSKALLEELLDGETR